MTFLIFSPLEQFEYLTVLTSGAKNINLYFLHSMLIKETILDLFGVNAGLAGFSSCFIQEDLDFFDLYLDYLPFYLKNMPSIIIEGFPFINDMDMVVQQMFIYDCFKSTIADNFWTLTYNVIVNGEDESNLIRLCRENPLYPLLLETVFDNFIFFCQLLNPEMNFNFVNVVENGEERLATPEEIEDLNLISFPSYTFIWLNIHNSIFIVIFIIFFTLIIANFLINNVRFSNIWVYITDLLIEFLFETYSSLVNPKLLKYFPLFVTLFLLVFISNLTALIPFSFCLTSNLWFTLTLSLMVWIGVTILAIVVRGKEFFTSFVPSSVPPILQPFLTIIEIISYVARAISLGVRIFANMLAGHSLVHILAELVDNCIISFSSVEYKLFGIFPAIILIFIVFIEFGICFLQALVFVILTAIYLNEAFGFNSH